MAVNRGHSIANAFLGVKGSPVQIRPSRLVADFFRIYFHYARANKRANLLCNGPSTSPRRARATAPHQDMCQDEEQASSPVKAPKITEPSRTCTTTPDTIPRPPADRSRTLTGVPQLQDAGKPGCSNQACPRRRKREAAGIRAAPRTGRRDRSDLHHLETRPHPRHGESAVQVSSQCDAPANEFSTLKLAARQIPSPQ